ncbi:indole-3-glycerol phosphate synthase TrpC [Peribacillus kribbensis]|uniref:indole-3-glycerol phosphate synthase TrpC n=1 Tax=Peribacillus kribbensis TaxID=356658 RepID=UPI0003F7D645|nr:indole-3-glycerol phosphate synthase TrpC [Peribacillus kribbensis]
MKDYLEPILQEKRKSLSQRSLPYINKNERQADYSLKKALERGFTVIAEFKRASPSKGAINLQADPVQTARMYEEAGADAMSVLTEETFFKGSMKDLDLARNTIKLPILCKDFMLETSQIDEAFHFGANIILLIVRALDDRKLKELYQYAVSLGLDVLTEVHNERELDRALEIGADIIGINNRNLSTFQIDLSVTEELAAKAKKNNAYVISESGITSLDDCRRVVKAGADGILVGEAFMRQDNPRQFLADMKNLKVESR